MSDLATAEPAAVSPRWSAGAIVELARPRVVGLVLFTAPPVLVAARAPLGVALVTLAGTCLLASACGALNAWVERDTDGLMTRTKRRPLPSRRLDPDVALWAGGIGVFVGLVLLATVGWLAFAVGVATVVDYVLVYTVWLKRRSPLNIVIGGAAGAAAPLIADAAAHGDLCALGWAPFLAIFLWTPAHFWAIALVRAEEYAAAGIPMLPLVRGARATRRQMLAYALACVPATLWPAWSGWAPAWSGVVAAVLGVGFVAVVARSLSEASREADRAVFKASIAYLAALFAVWSLAAAVS